MVFGQRQHRKKKKSENSFFAEARPVFKKVNWKDIQTEEDHLPHTFSMGMSRLENSLDDLREQKKQAESEELKVAGLRSRLSRLVGGKRQFEDYEDQLSKEDQLQKQLERAEAAYANFQKPIEAAEMEGWSVYGGADKKLSPEEEGKREVNRKKAMSFDEAFTDAETYASLRSALSRPELSQEELSFLMESDLSAFFSDKLRKKVERSMSEMAKRDRTANIFQMMDSGTRQVLETEWKKKRGQMKAEKKELQKKQSELEKKIRALKKKNLPDEQGREELYELSAKLYNTKENIQFIDYELENPANWINRRYFEEQARRDIFEEDNQNLAFLKTEEGQAISEDEKKLILKQANDETVREARIRKRADQLSKRESPLLGSVLDYESKSEVAALLLQAEHFERKKITDFIHFRYKNLETRFKELAGKKPPRLSKQSIEAIQKLLDENKIQYLNEDLINTFLTRLDQKSAVIEGLGEIHFEAHFKQCRFNLDKTEWHLIQMEKELQIFDERDKDKEAFNNDIRNKFARVQGVMGAFTEERVQLLLNELDQQEQNRITSIPPDQRHGAFDQLPIGQSPEYKKRRAAIKAMSNPDKEMMNYVQDQINNLDGLGPDELVDLKTSLDHLDSRLSQFKPESINERLGGLKLSADARRAIDEIQGLRDSKQIERALIERFGPEHIDFVSGGEFQNYNGKDLNQFTGGSMVFYQRSDGLWKIIVNRDSIGGNIKENVDALKEQLTHELLHLEIENSPQLMEEWKRYFGVDNERMNSGWHRIKQAYLEAFPNKEAPTEAGWTDEAVISELYAMQHDQIFKKPLKKAEHEKDAKDRLNQAIWDSGAAAKAAKDNLGIDIDKYKKDLELHELKESYQGFESSELASPAETAVSGESTAEAAIDKEDTGGSAKIYEERIKKINETIDSLLKSHYLNYIPGSVGALNLIRGYNNDTHDLNQEYAETSEGYLGSKIKERLDQMEKDLTTINKNIADVGSLAAHEEVNVFRDLWNRSHFFSPEDFWQVGVDVLEWWKRRHGRKKADHAARIGTALADNVPLPYVEEYGMEAKARKEKAEAEEVDEWKNRLSNKDAWELLSILKQLSEQTFPNADQLKAVLRILADKGRIDWRNPALWTVLSKLQTAAHLSPSDDSLLRNPVLLEQKLHQAMGNIWDYDEYLELKRTNESNYESGKEKYAATLDRIQDQLTDRLDQLLARHKTGENVDPQEYEGILEYCIKNGKSYAENIMFHLIMGIATGLLPQDRGLSLDKHLNTWPATQWIYSKKPPLTQKDYIYYAKTYFPEEFESGKINHENGKFMDFYWTMVQNDPMTIQRVRKSVGERSWDHDWGRSIACMGDANTAKRFLAGRSGQQEAKDTGVENSYVGAWTWFQKNAKYPDRIDARKEFGRQIAWVAMADGIIGHVAYYSGSSDIYTRGNASMLNAVPREGGLSGHGEWVTRDYRDRIRRLIDRLDPEFFTIIRNEAAAKADKKALGARARDHLVNRYPSLASEVGGAQDIDQIYDKMDAIVMVMINALSEDQFNRFINYVQVLDNS